MEILKELFSSFKPTIIAFTAWIVSHLNEFTAFIAFIVLIVNLIVVVLNYRIKRTELRLKLMQYDKECKGGNSGIS